MVEGRWCDALRKQPLVSRRSESLNPEPMPEVLSALVLVGVQNGNATLEEIESDL